MTTGERLLTPYGEAEVHSIEMRTMRLVTEDLETGTLLTWDLSEVEDMGTAPTDGDPEAMEAWLRCAGQIVPKLQVSDEMVRCAEGVGCDCQWCYSIERTIARRGDPKEQVFLTHMVDNTTMCKCAIKGCGCVAF